MPPSASSFFETAQQWWQSFTLTLERFIAPDKVAKLEATQHLEVATVLIEALREHLAEDQLDQARAALEQLLPLTASLPVDLQQEIARLEAMLADQPQQDI
ncbi:hypothetical protein CXB77_09370 [Chromatium okenii]|uniref:Uncharacterized protein n=2 Tax=Chromatium okenii TaxID=61644 RepID=A0A2S7XQV6_9GAMM|nr:hypothetical protein CXB77_09370 [Chromatium okenii]